MNARCWRFTTRRSDTLRTLRVAPFLVILNEVKDLDISTAPSAMGARFFLSVSPPACGGRGGLFAEARVFTCPESSAREKSLLPSGLRREWILTPCLFFLRIESDL